MTARAGSMSIDGTPISQADRARMQADEALQRQRQHQAVRVIAGQAQDVDDCRLLLDILGLGPQVVAAALGREPGVSAKPAAKSGNRRRGRAA